MKEFKVAFLGFGNVGTGTYKIIKENGSKIFQREGINITVKKILVRNVNKKRPVEVEPDLLTDNIKEIIEDPEIAVVAEFIGGEEPAREYILSALNNKKTVVTANKEVMARHWEELENAAIRNGCGLYYEASVAGGIPIIKVVRESLQGNNITEIMGIINGTTNYILTKMSEEERKFEDVLAEAQKLGYAEPDPTSDVEGYDAMYKLSILSTLAFHTRVRISDVYREGITNITPEDIAFGKELGYTLKLLAIAKKHGNKIEARVHPTFISADHPLATVRDAYNAIFIKGDAVGNLMLYGRGAGDLPTGSAVVSDIVNACLHQSKHMYSTLCNGDWKADEVLFDNNWETEFFIRMTVIDKPGVLAKIAGIFGKYGVSISSVIQKGRNSIHVPIIFVTHKAKEMSIKKAINEIKNEDVVIKIGNVIRVEH
ncbi:MAG TPA: homoserine dehydrogenase [Clostridiaceae bacterium]|nr:homoserine dehydrogenase [Clostridiaceae bacterium]